MKGCARIELLSRPSRLNGVCDRESRGQLSCGFSVPKRNVFYGFAAFEPLTPFSKHFLAFVKNKVQAHAVKVGSNYKTETWYRFADQGP